MNIKLYATYLSSSSERVRIALAMKKLDYEYVSVRDIGWDEIRKINPQGLVPAMVLGGPGYNPVKRDSSLPGRASSESFNLTK